MIIQLKEEAILEHYGIVNQSLQACEELAELIVAIIKCRRIQCGPYALSDEEIDADTDNLKEEIADAMIMIDQLIMAYDITTDEILEIMNQKLDRQLERIRAERSENEQQL